jgi:hypothetical protein
MGTAIEFAMGVHCTGMEESDFLVHAYIEVDSTGRTKGKRFSSKAVA